MSRFILMTTFIEKTCGILLPNSNNFVPISKAKPKPFASSSRNNNNNNNMTTTMIHPRPTHRLWNACTTPAACMRPKSRNPRSRRTMPNNCVPGCASRIRDGDWNGSVCAAWRRIKWPDDKICMMPCWMMLLVSCSNRPCRPKISRKLAEIFPGVRATLPRSWGKRRRVRWMHESIQFVCWHSTKKLIRIT